ncbi:uncharacterized protein LOC116619170 isoform X2 [Nematostella vectensis]|uniref:uncharacterized protein LOC116619170 isoform X2 n=1 Tax=Nematostella vectensis TaxID=45351 RepID=UPI0020770881|nr:uncharacterized protein LOC116619170 isoform X2 [Nematostella vectensis]
MYFVKWCVLVVITFSSCRSDPRRNATLKKVPEESINSTILVKKVSDWYSDSRHYWPFEDITKETVQDIRGGNHGKVHGDVHIVQGVVGRALEITGKNNTFIDLGLLSGSCLSDPVSCKSGSTVAFWLKLPSFEGNKIVMQLGQNRHSKGFTVWTRKREKRKEQKINFRVNTRTKKIQSEIPWNTTGWTHVTIVWRHDGTSPQLHIYFNCSLSDSVNESYPDTNERKEDPRVSLILGASRRHAKNAHILIDELAVWNRTLSKREVCDISNLLTVHGGYSDWSAFTDCSATCGSGERTRNRACSNPKPRHRGMNCSLLGPDREVQPCFLRTCPIHGGYSPWSEFSPCSKSCGGGEQFRNRTCTNPMPQHGGRNCSGPETSYRTCNENACPINGRFGQWSDYSKCSVSCGHGNKTRTRSCDSPSPAYGGSNCSGFFVQAISCFVSHCPAHRRFSEWSDYGSCSKSCGGGEKYRNRKCTNPTPQHGGENCSGDVIESVACNTQSCPRHGNYSAWSQFSACSASCGEGFKTRNRTCTNPAPQHGGRSCSLLGEAVETVNCTLGPCPIDGGYTPWREFTLCTKLCGGGWKYRTRRCINPEPQFGGRNCTHLGPSFEKQRCNVHPCPINGSYTEWSPWFICSKPCEKGLTERIRTCTDPPPQYGGADCAGGHRETQTKTCNDFPCPIHGGYSNWSSFTECTKSCGNGTITRNRTCTNPVPRYNGNNCTVVGPAIEILPCNTHPCPVHGNYTAWSTFTECSKSCENGTRYRYRNCSQPLPQHGGRNCSHLGDDKEQENCNTHMCPIHGGYTEWTNFTECTVSCGNGTKFRNRTCTNPEPRHGGRDCDGPAVEILACNTHFCPIHGGYTMWSNFTTCSVSCGNGTRTRIRNCTNPPPKHNGRTCDVLGPRIETQPCNTFYCPVDGGYTQWSEYSQCSKTCGLGEAFRTRNCTNPKPQHGGKGCQGASTQRRVCVIVLNCPVDGGYTQWTKYSECSKSCGNGTTNRTRMCTNPAPRHGGEDCEHLGPDIEITPCNEHPCPIHGGYTSWTTFTTCSLTCGGGTSYRYRNCTSPIPRHGGSNCSVLGPAYEENECNTVPCPIDGGLTPWSNYSQCDKSCGMGTKMKTKSCTNPKPQYGGKDCSHLGSLIYVINCNTHPCPIDGKYSKWSHYSGCDKSCGNGTRIRTRTCTRPRPEFGGRNCSMQGPNAQTIPCYLRPCPIDGQYSNWSKFTVCTKSCGTGVQTRTRECNNPVPQYGGSGCERFGNAKETQQCNTMPCPIDGGYTEWSSYAPCTVTCGGGVRLRVRNCTKPAPQYGGRNCSTLGPSGQIIPCANTRCPAIVFNITLNLTGEAWDPELKNEKSVQRARLERKIKTGIEVIYEFSLEVESISIWSFRKGSVLADLSVEYANELYKGIAILQDAICQRRDLGGLAAYAVRLTTQDVPSRAPQSVSGYNVSSTAICIQWLPVSLNYSNGPILEYRISAEKIGLGGSRARRSLPRPNYSTSSGEANSTEIFGLSKYTMYKIRVAGRNRRGVGIESSPIYVMTGEDKPAIAPANISAVNLSSTSISVSWSALPGKSIPGVLRGYRLVYSPVPVFGQASLSGHTDVGPDSTHAILTGLKKYTEYVMDVLGFTSIGEGPSARVTARTSQDVPSQPPPNITTHNTSSTSILVQWGNIPFEHVHGILTGYVVSYFNTETDGYNWTEVSVGKRTTSYQLQLLDKYTKYCIQVQGVTVKGEGKDSKATCVYTAEDIPDAHPLNVTGFNKSSTQLYIEWQHIAKKEWNGIPRGYRVFYQMRDDQQRWQSADVNPSADYVTLRALRKFTWYRIRVAAFTVEGVGPQSPVLERRTAEDVPSRPVISVKARNLSHTSLIVEWKNIPSGYVHGILQGFRVHYWRKGHRDEEKSLVVEPDKTSTVLDNLLIYTVYAIQILGFTSVGDGAISKEIHARTDEFTPGVPPINLSAWNKTSPTHLTVSWEPIPDPYDVHGILRGYRVLYAPIAVANKTLTTPPAWSHVTVQPDMTSVKISNLAAFTRYNLAVLAFTVKGDGIRSANITAETCNCHSAMYTNWWENPPYVETPGSFNHSGIIPAILEHAISTCCGNCSEFGTTKVNFTHSSADLPKAKKSGLQRFRDGIDQSTELSFPVYGFMSQTRYSGDFGFVPLVQSPGVALIVIGDEEGTAARLLIRSIMLCWPIVLLDMMLLWVMSIVIWFTETFNNPRHFPHNMLQGMWEGMWWAFASMTTLGYGDRIPRSYIGRLICVLWIVIGVILIACFNSTMTTILTARILDKDVMLYGTKVAAIQNSSEYRLGVRKNARVNPNGKPYANLEDVYDALVSREVKGVLIDAYTVGSRKKLFDRRDLRINKLMDYKSAYGVVLGGEARKLQQCFQTYLGEQRSEVSGIIESNIQTIEVSTESLSVDRSKGLFDPNFPTYTKTMIVFSVILILILVIGAKFECAKKIGWISFNKKESTKVSKATKLKKFKEEFRQEMSLVVRIFLHNCEKKMAEMRIKHRKELYHLIRLKRMEETGQMYNSNPFHYRNIFDIFCKNKQYSLASTLSPKDREKMNGLLSFSSPFRRKKAEEVETVV